jgi:hypothetical protein
MSFALYGESDAYVHLISADTQEQAVSDFLADLREFNVPLHAVINVYAVEGRDECKDLEDLIQELIEEAIHDQR